MQVQYRCTSVTLIELGYVYRCRVPGKLQVKTRYSETLPSTSIISEGEKEEVKRISIVDSSRLTVQKHRQSTKSVIKILMEILTTTTKVLSYLSQGAEVFTSMSHRPVLLLHESFLKSKRELKRLPMTVHVHGAESLFVSHHGHTNENPHKTYTNLIEWMSFGRRKVEE